MRLLRRKTVQQRLDNRVDLERRVALLMITTGLLRVVIWTIITVAYVLKVPLVEHWFSSVAFVALLSILALVLTDWGQVVSSFAAYVAGDVHRDVEHVREEFEAGMVGLVADLHRLAAMFPGRESDDLAEEISQKVRRDNEPPAD